MALKCKGVSKLEVRANLDIELYRSCIKFHKVLRLKQNRLQGIDHKMRFVQTRKIALSSVDVKRYILPCGRHTLSYYHWRIKNGSAAKACHICHYTTDQMRAHLRKSQQTVCDRKKKKLRSHSDVKSEARRIFETRLMR